MEARITVKMDNEAFSEDPAFELARILRELADTIQGYGLQSGQNLRDLNGNQVGKMDIFD